VSPRPRSIEDAAIFRATARVIGRVGPAHLTVARVAKEAGLAPSSLVERFGTRRNLLLAFAAQAGEGVRATFVAARQRERRPRAALLAALHDLAAPVSTPEAMANNLAFLQMDLADEDFRHFAVAHGEAFRDEAAGLLREMQAGLPVRAAAMRARDLQIAFNGALITWAVHREGTLRDAISQALDLVFTGPR
jgi:AcrR family transcriptional regulator